jgi:hypothetical protein
MADARRLTTDLRDHTDGDFEADRSAPHQWYVDRTAEETRQVAGPSRSSAAHAALANP